MKRDAVEGPATIGLMSPDRLTRSAMGRGMITGADTAGTSTALAVTRFASRPIRLYSGGASVHSLRNELALIGSPESVVHTSAHLARHLSLGEIQALHGLGPDLRTPAAARSRFSKQVVPVTAMQNSISQLSAQLGTFLPLFFVDLYSCDAVVCATQCARESELRILARMAAALDPGADPRSLPIRHEVIPLSIDTEEFRPALSEERDLARRTLGLPISGQIVLYVGRIDQSSKCDLTTVLLAFRLALGKLNGPCDVHLVLAGYDPTGELPGLLTLAEEYGFADRLHVHIDYPPALQPLLYQAADLFISLSDAFENFGLTPVEAMACGLPVVVSDWAGYRETVEEGVTGFRVKTLWAPEEADLVASSGFLDWTETHLPLAQGVIADVGEAADRIVALLSNNKLRFTMGAAARQHVLSEYAAPVFVGRMEALWSELALTARSIEKQPAPPLSLHEAPCSREMLPLAAEMFPEDARLVLSEFGREILRGSLTLPLTGAQNLVYNRDVLLGLLGAIKSGSVLGRGLPYADIATHGARKWGLGVPSARRHLIWLVKHGAATMR